MSTNKAEYETRNSIEHDGNKSDQFCIKECKFIFQILERISEIVLYQNAELLFLREQSCWLVESLLGDGDAEILQIVLHLLLLLAGPVAGLVLAGDHDLGGGGHVAPVVLRGQHQVVAGVPELLGSQTLPVTMHGSW